jgi:hypothetical protein
MIILQNIKPAQSEGTQLQHTIYINQVSIVGTGALACAGGSLCALAMKVLGSLHRKCRTVKVHTWNRLSDLSVCHANV